MRKQFVSKDPRLLAANVKHAELLTASRVDAMYMHMVTFICWQTKPPFVGQVKRCVTQGSESDVRFVWAVMLVTDVAKSRQAKDWRVYWTAGWAGTWLQGVLGLVEATDNGKSRSPATVLNLITYVVSLEKPERGRWTNVYMRWRRWGVSVFIRAVYSWMAQTTLVWL